MNPQYSNYQLHAKIDYMEQFIDLDSFIRGDKNTPDQIYAYYKLNHLIYRLHHSQEGFMHFRVSQNGCFTDEDIYYQPDFIAKYIRKGDNVLELGSGQGANLLYLAHSFPSARFTGLDLSEYKGLDQPDNARFFQMDYSDLRRFKDSSFDVIYAIETLVHAKDKEKVLREVKRVLKPGGRIIYYDYALSAEYNTFDAHVQKAIALISKGGAAAMIESEEQLRTHFRNVGFTQVHDADLSRETLPDLRHLERKAHRILKRPKVAEAVFQVLPERLVSNIILGYLGFDSCNAGVITYQEWVFRK